MKSAKNLLLVVLALAAIGSGVLAWREHRELVDLRASALKPSERAALQKRIWELEKANRALTARADASENDAMLADANSDREESASDERAGRGGFRRRGPGGPFRQITALRDLATKPEVQALINAQQKTRIASTYAALFHNLNLTPDQADKLATLLAERGTTRMDVMAAARDQGLNPRENPDALRRLMADARNDVDDGIKSLIGDAGFSQLQTYEQTMPQRNVVNELQQRLAYSGNPLTAGQAEQLVSILATNAPAANAEPANAPSPGGPVFFDRRVDIGGAVAGLMGGGAIAIERPGRGPASAPITPAAVAQAQTVLSPPQLTALQQLQQQQAAQQQLAQIVRDTLKANANPSAPPPEGGARSGNAPQRGNP